MTSANKYRQYVQNMTNHAKAQPPGGNKYHPPVPRTGGLLIVYQLRVFIRPSIPAFLSIKLL